MTRALTTKEKPHMKASRTLASAAVAGLLALSACSTKAESSEGGDGPGVTEDTITLGVITDQSGPFKDLGSGTLSGHEIWVEETNAQGGVCGRDVELLVRDHAYSADTGVLQYQEIEPEVLGFMQIFGSSVNASLDQNYQDDEAMVTALSWSSFILKNPYVIVPGTTYDLEMINGLSYLMDQGLLEDGDTMAHIYLEGEYGENGLLGSEYFADQHDITLEKVKVLPTDTDLRNIVTGLQGKGVSAIALTTSPAQTLSVATVSDQLGLDVPMVGNNPAFSPQILTPDTAGVLDDFYAVASTTPFTSDVPKAKEIAAAYTATGDKQTPNAGIPYGYAIAEIWGQLLESTCDDLTREGIAAAVGQASSISTDDLVADLDFSTRGAPATRSVYVARPSLETPGGVEQASDLFVSPDAETYVAPEEG